MFIDDSPYYLGRGHDSDVRISDISVSRTHARIYLKDKRYYLEDTGSKFGTLILAKDAVELGESKKILQIGRTLLSVQEVKKYDIFSGESKSEMLVEDKEDFVESSNINKFDKNKFFMPDDDDFNI
jgi:pSer/pThr/pTyr-binding forkhead associated (FHA) protein